MTLALSAVPELDSLCQPGFKAQHLEITMDNDPLQSTINTVSRKRKRTRKAQPDRKFECTFEGCGKSYSRAEHLYRHQLNHTPKQIYRCDFPGCYRSFVRQDLCIRHRERHTTQGSQLQKRDQFTHAASATMKPGPPLPSTTSTLNSQPMVSQPVSGVAFPPQSTPSPNHSRSSPPGHSSTFSPPGLRDASFTPFTDGRSANGSVASGDMGHKPQSRHSISEAASTRSQDGGRAFSVSGEINGSSLAGATPYATQPGLQVPVSSYSNISLPSAVSSTPSTLDQTAGLNTLNSISGMMATGSGVEPGFDSLANSVYPVFGSESYNRSPFTMADDFTAWLFNEPMGYPPAPNMVPNYMEPGQLQNQFLMGDAPFGAFYNSVLPNHPMSVTSILDPGSPRAILSEEKRQELLHLMSTRFNEAAYSAVAKRKDALMGGDMDDDNHVLSLRMMQTYVGSYWYHFHAQLPILHRPTFVADQAPNLLLLGVIAIGAATLDRIHGPEVTEAASELADFIIWHLRWEIFMDADFRPPAKLWIFQALLLLEVYEKMYSTRAMHERAHIHHDTTLTLMRRGSSLIGRSAFDSPASMRDDRLVRSASASVSTPDFAADDSWTNWINAEATRRVAFAAFALDSTHATMFGHSAKMVAHELRLPLPCDEALWSATSATEVARVQSSLHANGVKPVMFLDGLKRTLNGQRVRTNAFGRTILMAGLLSVSWHMNQRDLQVSSLGVPHALGGRDKWRSALLRAFDHWRRDFDEALGGDASGSGQSGHGSPPFPSGYSVRHLLEDDNVFESRDVLHGLAHMASHVDVVDCQIFAGAGRLMGRSITPRDYNAAREKMTERWAMKASARDATFYALKFLSECLLHHESAVTEEGEMYCGRDDYLLNRPWVIYVAALVVWCYGFALEGPIRTPPALETVAEQRRDMEQYLRRLGSVRSPDDLETMKGRNQCLGLLMILRDGFVNSRWELLAEAAGLLGSCITKLRGG
ncbi:C2H2 finger domain protein [Aspergillus ambiguus]|uniref:putative C2H2 finger domain protein n=1 Tax=Aspergillus ambiguus TaxID=176160 RepID=UPI003CCDEC60